MRSKYGKLLTPQRLRLLEHYRRSRWRMIEYNPRLTRREYDAACAWVRDFERFMCQGWDPELERYDEPQD